MTVSAVPRRALYAGNGTTTTFAVPFQFFEINVYLDDVLVDPVNYTINQVKPGASGDIVFNTAPASGADVVIEGATVIRQETDYVENDDFPAESHEAALDRLTMVCQELADSIGEIAVPGDLLPDVNAATDDPMVITVVDDKPYQTPASAILSGGQFSLIGRGHNVGDIVMHALPDVPSGWIRIKRDPQPVLKSSYPEYDALCASAGYPYGHTSTHVNVPGGAGLFPRIWDDTSTLDPDAASRLDHATALSAVGNVIGSRQLNQNKAHVHVVDGGAHQHELGGASSVQAATGARDIIDRSGSGYSNASNGSHSHNVSSEGGNEARPANIAWPFIMLLSPGEASAFYSSFGLPLKFDTGTTDANPGLGKLRYNNANPALVTEIYCSRESGFSADITTLFTRFNSSTAPIKAVISIHAVSNLAVWAEYEITGTVDDSDPDYMVIPVSYVGHVNSLPNNAFLSVTVLRAGSPGTTGATGATGATGPAGSTGAAAPLSLDMTWSTATSGDPGSGGIRINHATPASLTGVAFSETDRLGSDKSALIATFDDSTNTSRARVDIIDVVNNSNWLSLFITSAITDAGAYDTFTASYIGHGGTLASGARVSVIVTPIGNKGADGAPGAGGGDVTAASNFGTDNVLIRSDGTTKGVQGSNVSVDDAGNIALPANVSFTGIISPPQITATQNNYAPTGLANATVLRLDLNSNRTITGIDATGVVGGRVLIIENISSSTLQLSNESGSSTAANRFALGSTLTIRAGEVCALIYDGTASRWRALLPPGILRSNISETLAVGYVANTVANGSISSGTLTPNPALGNMQSVANGGAHTLAAPTATGSYTIVLQYTNSGTAGAITFSGFNKVTGDTLTTTNGDDYFIFITKIDSFVHAHKQLLQ